VLEIAAGTSRPDRSAVAGAGRVLAVEVDAAMQTILRERFRAALNSGSSRGTCSRTGITSPTIC